MEYKEIIGLLAVALLFVGYIPYLIDSFRGSTRPHVFSFLVATLVTGTLFFLQLSEGGGYGAWVTAGVSIISFVLVLLGLKHGKRDIAPIDIVFLLLALSALPLWLLADQPLLSTILLVSTGVFGFIPTLRKSWHDPHSETLSMWFISGIRHGLSIFALTEINLITALFPIAWVVVNIFMVCVLFVRRYYL